MQDPVVFQFDKNLLQGGITPADRYTFAYYFKALTLEPIDSGSTAQDPSQDIEVLRRLLQSEMGWLFFDRTRIRPQGFAVGEHVFSLSLAPGEEVVIEQRTFSKRETTYEEQTEQERQVDLELSSTLSTELAEGVDRDSSRTEQTGFNLGGSVGGTFQGVNVNVDAGYSSNVSEASSQSRTRSVKDSSTASSKVASKYRAMHKTTFKVATEDRFEQGSKRVVRNPNRYTAMDLHYFKILRTIELTQERYGVRLCWAPAVQYPADDVLQQIELGRRKVIERALSSVDLPPKPAEPAKSQKPPVDVPSAVAEADHYGLTGDMSWDYDLAISIPQGYLWNGDIEQVKQLTRVWGRPADNMGWHIVGVPVVNDGQLIVRIHVGAGSWVGGPKIWMQAKARFVAAPAEDDPEYRKKYEEWQTKVAEWEAETATRLEGARRRGEADADQWEHEMIASINPVVALMERIAKTHFAGTLSDEPWEVEFWGQVFDWQRAGVSLYPAWWSTRPTQDYRLAPDHFLNASWAKLYLPVKPGFERLALRWIVGKVRDQQLDEATEAAFQRIADELSEYRKQTFGDASETRLGGQDGRQLQEQFLVLGRWTETVPTDGTHVEIVQSMTSALDAVSKGELEQAQRSRAIQAASEEQDVELKKKALAEFGNKPPNVDVRIATDAGGNGSNA